MNILCTSATHIYIYIYIWYIYIYIWYIYIYICIYIYTYIYIYVHRTYYIICTYIYSIKLCTINYTLSVTYLYPWCRPHTRWYPCDTRGMLLHHPSGIRLCRPSPREDMASPKPCGNDGEMMGKLWETMGK